LCGMLAFPIVNQAQDRREGAIQGCQQYVRILTTMADNWVVTHENRTYNMRDQANVERYQKRFDYVDHPGMRSFLKETVKYLWEREDRARRFLENGRFMEQCLPAQTAYLEKKYPELSKAQIRERLERLRAGREVRPVVPQSAQRKPDSRQAQSGSQMESTAGTGRQRGVGGQVQQSQQIRVSPSGRTGTGYSSDNQNQQSSGLGARR